MDNFIKQYHPELMPEVFDDLPAEEQVDVLRRLCIELLLVLSVHAHTGPEQRVVVPFDASALIEGIRFHDKSAESPKVGTA